MAEALYRKYRPKIFEDVVGQEHIERTLKNAIRYDKVSHAYLFTGPRGTGKTTTARLLAKALLCQAGDGQPTADPDGTCEDCLLIAEGEHPDVSELDAASRTGVENVREEIIGRVNYAPTRGRYKVYIIDEVHMLSTAAFNALLKTLEEPPEHVVFVLCTTDPQKVPETIHSRCQRFDFRRISNEELVSRLGAICEMEGVQFEGDALDLIAHRAEGGMRDALTSLEQLMSFGEGQVTIELAERLLGSLDSSDLAEIVRAIGQRDAAACFRWTSEYMETGADLAQFTQDLSQHMRDMYVMSLAGADVALEVSETGRRELEAEMAMFGPDRLANLLGVLGDLSAELKTSTNQRLSFEIALTRMVRPDSDLTLSALAERIEALESGVNATAPGVVQAAPQAVQVAETQPATSAEDTPPWEAPENNADAEPVGAQFIAPEPTEVRPTTEAGTSTAPADAGALSQLWATAMAHLKKTSQAYQVLFLNASPARDEASQGIVVQFGEGTDFAFNAAQKPEVREALADALAKAGAPGVNVKMEKIAGAVSPADIVNAVVSRPSAEVEQPKQEAAQPEPAPSHPQPAQEEPYVPESDPVPLSEYEEMAAEVVAAEAEPAPSHPMPHSEPADAGSGSSPSDLNDALAAAFGEGISFEQVDE